MGNTLTGKRFQGFANAAPETNCAQWKMEKKNGQTQQDTSPIAMAHEPGRAISKGKDRMQFDFFMAAEVRNELPHEIPPPVLQGEIAPQVGDTFRLKGGLQVIATRRHWELMPDGTNRLQVHLEIYEEPQRLSRPPAPLSVQ